MLQCETGVWVIQSLEVKQKNIKSGPAITVLVHPEFNPGQQGIRPHNGPL
jgi:hypothetical protein